MPEFSNLMIIFAAGGFFAGILLATIAGRARRRALSNRMLEINKKINSLLAENNVISKNLKLQANDLTAAQEAIKEREARIKALETAFEARTEQFAQTQTDLKDAVKKTQELRKDLVDHAEDTLRAQVHAREIENELDMLHGSGEMLDSEVIKSKP